MREEIRGESTSGGAFSLFALSALNKNGMVFGAAWTDDFNLKITSVNNSKDLHRLRHSKYVQSDASDSYAEVKDLLEKGTAVLYSACPCQIAGLNSYLDKDYPNLITIDILCGNVPSIKMFHKYLSEFTDIRDIKDIVFRDGSLGNDPHNHRIEYKDGRSELKSKWTGDPYQKAYHTPNLMANEVCRCCSFAKIPRQGDITIGDFWGIKKIDPSWDDGRGTSVVLVNSSKGESFLKDLVEKVERIEEIPIEKTLSTPNRFNSDGHYGPYEQRKFFTERLKSPDSEFSDAVSKALHEKYDIGLVTALSHNYGGNLTYYALFKYLKGLGKSVLIIDRRKDSPAPPHSNPFRTFEETPYSSWEVYNNIKNKKELRELNNKCDFFMLGSDQMLHPNFILKFGEHTCLNWVYSYKPKIAYAASYGKDTFEGTSEFKSAVGEMLRRFDYFSVREKSAVGLSKREFDIDAVHVLDPVFMLDANEYLEFSRRGKIKFPDGYVGSYILDPNGYKTKILKDIASSEDLPISLIKDTYADPKKYLDCGLTPLDNVKVEDWINNVANCKLFVTDSFHGACFAIIFKKPVIIIDNPLRGSTRISSLVDMFGLRNVLVDSPEFIPNDFLSESKSVDWDRIHKKLKSEIKRSKKWLNEALKCKEKQNVSDDYDNKWDENIQSKHSGIGVEKDTDSAIHWMRKSAESGSDWAKVQLVSLLMKCDSEKEKTEAFTLCKEYIEQGVPNLEGKMAQMYSSGIGVEKDTDSAIHWMRKSAESGSDWAKVQLVSLLMKCDSEKEKTEAFTLCKEYIEQGVPNLEGKMAQMYSSGIGVEKDTDSAIHWMRKSAESGSDWAKVQLVSLLMKCDSEKEKTEAFTLCKEYIEQGVPNLEGKMAQMYSSGIGVEKDTDSAIHWMRKSAESGSDWAKKALLDILIERDNEEEYEEIHSLMSELSLKEIKYKQMLAKCLFRGDYTEVDIMAAEQLLLSQNDDISKLMLSDIYIQKKSIEYRKKAVALCKSCIASNSELAWFRLNKWNSEKVIQSKFNNSFSTMNILILSSNEYSKYASVLIKSIICNNPYNLRFFILTTGISERNKELLNCYNSDTVAIQYITIDLDYINSIRFPEDSPEGGRWSKMSLFRLIPNLILPDDVNRVLSLGADTIVDGDLGSLYSKDLNNVAVVGTYTDKDYKLLQQNGKCDLIPNKINGDMLLMNVDLFRKMDISVESYAEASKKFVTEESLLPALFREKVHLVDPYTYNYRIDPIISAPSKYQLILPKPIIIQYVWYQKPWAMYSETEKDFNSNYSKLLVSRLKNNTFRKWWKYAKLCNHYDDLYSDLKLTRSNLAYHAYQFEKQINTVKKNFYYYSDFILNLFINGDMNKLLNKLKSYPNIVLVNDTDNIYKELFKRMGLSTLSKQTSDTDIIINCDISKETNFRSIKDLLG